MISIAPTARLAWPVRNRRRANPLPTTCGGWTPSHDAVNPKVYRLGVDGSIRNVAVLCNGCRDHVALFTSVHEDERWTK